MSEEKMNCPFCGDKITSDSVRCPSCGKELKSYGSSLQDRGRNVIHEITKKFKAQPTPVRYILVIFAGLAVLAIGYWLFGSSEVISIRDTVERNGMIYKVNSTRPFTGVIRSGGGRFLHEYKKGKLHGSAIRMHSNGQVAEEAEYRNGVLSGKEYHYSEDGELTYEAKYKNGQRYGTETYYYNDGQVRCNTHYKDGMKDGLCEHFHPDGKINEKGLYTKDLQTGKWITNEADGCIREVFYKAVPDGYGCSAPFALPEGTVTVTYPNGKVKAIEHYAIRKNGSLFVSERSGEMQKYDPNGQLLEKSHYVNGYKNGLHEEYYPNGKPKLKCTYKNSIPDLACDLEEFYDNGARKKFIRSENGNVRQEEFAPDGKLQYLYVSKSPKWGDILPEGLLVYEKYNAFGKLEKSIRYDSASRKYITTECRYFDNGKLRSEDSISAYKIGEYASKTIRFDEYNEAGQLISRSTPKGTESFQYYPNGKIRLEVFAKDLNSQQKIYYDEQGKVIRKEVYDQGRLVKQ